MFASGEVHEGEFVALRRFFLLAEFEADFFVKSNGGSGIRDANAGVEELNHGWKCEGKWSVCEVWSCDRALEALEIPRLEII